VLSVHPTCTSVYPVEHMVC